jgi:prepilin-type N-terminal cleavage/methylation domain-containing protein/prepilin-type processing-associated H-X9-DG protein
MQMPLNCIYARRPRGSGFTLVELLVVIGILAMLVSILLPVLSAAQGAARRTKCLSNLRNMQVAQTLYCVDNRNYLIQAGLGHGGAHQLDEIAWFNTLNRYYQNKLVARCPADLSPHWGPAPEGVPIPGAPATQRRLTSYGINPFLDRDMVPWGGPYAKITDVPRTSATVQFLEMTPFGEYAGADHPHVETWIGPLAARVAWQQCGTDMHGGRAMHWDAKANWGFLDGHAETLRLRDVMPEGAIATNKHNRLDPATAR